MTNQIAYLGNPGSFGFEAANTEYGPAGNYVGYPSHSAVFNAVANGEATYGVMAIENVDAGLVSETIRSVVRHQHANPQSKLKVSSEVLVPVHLKMMTQQNTDITAVKTLASHEMALLQSSKFVEGLLLQYPSIRIVKVNSTSEAARMAAEDPTLAALASDRSMHEFELSQIIAGNTENKVNNYTRFWVVSREMSHQTGIDKSCVILNLNRDLPGSLAKTLECFAREKINLSIVHPSPHPEYNFEYQFVVEIEAHQESPKMQRALKSLSNLGLSTHVIGSYPNRSTAFTSAESVYNKMAA